MPTGASFVSRIKQKDGLSKGRLTRTRFRKLLFGGCNRLIVQCGVHGVPGQRRAFYSDREFSHAGEHSQIAKAIAVVFFIADYRIAGDHAMKLLEKCFRLLLALALQRLRHHAGCGFGNRAAGALEADFLHRALFQIQIDGEVITAERIEALGRMIRRLKLAKVPRLLVVVENDLLI